MKQTILDSLIILLFSFFLVIIGCIVIDAVAKQSNIEVKQGKLEGFLSQNNSLDEVSGLVASRSNNDILWIHEDDWGPYIYAINTDGEVLRRYQVGLNGYDVEDIAIGPGPIDNIDYLYIGHIGDNNASRSYIYVRRIPEPQVNLFQSYDEINITSYDTIRLQYPDGAKDAETLMVDTNADIYIVSKRLSENKIYMTKFPQKTNEIITLKHIATLPKKPEFRWITAGDISSNGDLILLRNDQDNDMATLWQRNNEKNLANIFNNEYITIDINDEPQGEAICFAANVSGFYTLSEHTGFKTVPIWYYQISMLDVSNQENQSGFNLILIFIISAMSLIFVVLIITKNEKSNVIIMALALIIVIGFFFSTNVLNNDAVKTDLVENPDANSFDYQLNITINSSHYSYSLYELKNAFPIISGFGTKKHENGSISLTNKYSGISVYDLIHSIDSLPTDYVLLVTTDDNEYNFSKEQIEGNIEVYQKNGELLDTKHMSMIVIYEINDEFIMNTVEPSFMIGFIDEQGSITDSKLWVRSINQFAVKKVKDTKHTKENIPPIVSINVSEISGYAPLTIFFKADASDPDGTIISYRWDFGDESFDYNKQSQHTYKKTGSYLATFKATDNNGSSTNKTVQITVNYRIVNGCISPADYNDPSNNWKKSENAFDENVDTYATCTKKGIWKWKWTGFLELISPACIRCNKIRFKAWYNPVWCNEIDIDIFQNNKWIDIYKGEYSNKEWEIIKFPYFNISKARVRFSLRQTPQGVFAELYEFDFYSQDSTFPPIADFSFHPTDPCRNQNIYFTDDSFDKDGIVSSWHWDFGDGSESILQNPIHKYSDIKTYQVNLTIKDDEGLTDTITKVILIENQKPSADFIYAPTNPTVGDIVYFTDKSSDSDGTIKSWYWSFGDGNISTEQNPPHHYGAIGTYTIKLLVKDNDGEASEISKNIIIDDQPNEDIILSLIYNGDEKMYSLEDLQGMDLVTGFGGRLNSVGSIAGPFVYKGVRMSTLASEFPSLSSSFTLRTIADDGYTVDYTEDEIHGDVLVYDIEGNEQGIGGVTMILAYEEEGISDFPGGPLRVAFVDDEEQLTDSFLWSKHVIEIEFEDSYS